MKKYVMAAALTLVSTSAFAGTLVCKGGLLIGMYNRVVTLTDADDSGVMKAYKANSQYGGYGFHVTPEGSSRTLESYGNKDQLVAKSTSAGHDAYLSIPLNKKGDEAYVSCWDEEQ